MRRLQTAAHRDPLGVMRAALPHARWTTVWATAVALAAFLTTCSPSEEAAEQPSVEAAPDTEPVGVAPPARPVQAAAMTREPRVPHAPHRALECVSCHQAIPGHATHGEIRCSECHPAPARYASMPLPSQTDCMECHHGGALAARCTNCHARSSLPGPVTVAARMQVAGWDGPRERNLPFEHTRHASLNCTDCHSESVTRSPEVECRTCHEQHHRLDADCRQCHSAISQSVHTEAAHRGCGGAGCHEDAVVAAFPPLRSVCLVCHVTLAEHNAPQECAVCHGIPETWRGATPSPGQRP